MELLFPALASPAADRVALRVGDRALTQRELATACAHHAAALAAEGHAPGARIGVWTEPALETLVALVAHAHAGYVSVPLDPKLGTSELAHVLADAAPAARFGAEPRDAHTRAIAIETSTPAPALPPAAITDAPALVLYTSGTTGAPKGALLTARNIAANLDMLARAWAWTAEDTVVHALPVFHVHGLVLGLFGSQRRGGALRWVPRFTPEALAGAAREESARGPALVFAVPTMYHRICERAAQVPGLGDGLRAARLLVSGSAPLSAREHAAIEQLTGHRAIERYGLTETLIDCSTRAGGERRAGSVGPALEGVELRLVDEARAPLSAAAEGAGESGEIAVRGPHVFAGYLNRPDATAAVLDAAGWFYTGDIATRAPDGFVTIVGRRATDIIKCGGFKVGAGEVEAALRDHPAVAEAAVIGAPDADLGERIVAFVVVRTQVATSALADHVAAQLSPHKRPREIHVVEALPRNAMGKVQKALLARRGQ